MQRVSFDDIRNISEDIYKFLTEKKISAMPIGRYDLTDKIYVNIETYSTQSKSERDYESHRKYVDLQLLISGSETIYVKPSSDLSVKTAYLYDDDIEFYNADEDLDCSNAGCVLKSGEGIMIYPGEAHMPCIHPVKNISTEVKKAVFKIPVSFFKNIKLFVMDVDGTLTDGKLYLSNNGELCKAFNIKDGCGIRDILIPSEIEPIIITTRSSEIVKIRCEELGIKKLYQAVSNKKDMLIKIAKDSFIELQNIAYIGDDINDIQCMQAIKQNGGLVGCPADAVVSVKKMADFVSSKVGGDGAVRDFIEWIVKD